MFPLKHLGGGAFGTACLVCDPNGDRVAVLRNSPEADAIAAGYSVTLIPGRYPVVRVQGKPTREQVLQALTAGWTITRQTWEAGGVVDGDTVFYRAMRVSV